MSQPRLSIQPCTQAEAFGIVGKWHRHHKRPKGATMCLACYDDSDGRVCGVAVLGRPVARRLQDGRTWEVLRVATDGTPNACSALYGAAGRIGRLLGLRLITYTLPEEGGASLRGAGWACDGAAGGGEWSRAKRQRANAARPEVKTRWTMDARRDHPALCWPSIDSNQMRLFPAKEST